MYLRSIGVGREGPWEEKRRGTRAPEVKYMGILPTLPIVAHDGAPIYVIATVARSGNCRGPSLDQFRWKATGQSPDARALRGCQLLFHRATLHTNITNSTIWTP